MTNAILNPQTDRRHSCIAAMQPDFVEELKAKGKAP